MSAPRFHSRFAPAVSAVLLAAYLIVTLGVLPSPALIARWSGNIFAQQYPCAGGGCGCPSAEECWTRCHCNSPHERLVWAMEHGVMPPAYAQFTDEQWLAAAGAVMQNQPILPVADLKDQLQRGIALAPESEHDDSTPDCCRTVAKVEPTDSCCNKSTPLATDSCHESDPAAPSSWPVPSLSAFSCKGLLQLLLISPPPAPSQTVATILPPPPAPVLAIWPEDETSISQHLETPEPPPRALSHMG